MAAANDRSPQSESSLGLQSALLQFPHHERFLGALFDYAPYGVFITRPNGRIAACNDHVCQLIGYSRDEIVDHHFNEFTHPDDHAVGVDAIRTIIAGKLAHTAFEKRYIHRNGDILWLEINIGVVRDDQGAVEFFVTTFNDITHRRQAERDRVAAQEAIIEGQREVLRQISTPLMPIADGIIAMPLVGPVDRDRAQQMLSALMDGVTSHAAHTVIIDIAGVPNVDTEVAELLAQATQVVKLLGAEALFAGIRPDVARNILALGVDLTSFQSAGSFQSAIALARRRNRSR
ncbi:MAG TPA: PAS domain S-box protein [Polyangium sp.]|nr:PAS domain S-box protein [Polyangium sp.]